MTEFHPCPNPWCGSSEIEVAHVSSSAFTRNDAFWCKCIQCGIAGPSRGNRAAAVSAWNEVPSGASPEIDALRAENARLREALEKIRRCGDGVPDSERTSHDVLVKFQAVKRCPYCRGEAHLIEGDEVASIQCVNAKFHRLSLHGDNNVAADLVESWNLRPAESALTAERDALRAALADMITAAEAVLSRAEETP